VKQKYKTLYDTLTILANDLTARQVVLSGLLINHDTFKIGMVLKKNFLNEINTILRDPSNRIMLSIIMDFYTVPGQKEWLHYHALETDITYVKAEMKKATLKEKIQSPYIKFAAESIETRAWAKAKYGLTILAYYDTEELKEILRNGNNRLAYRINIQSFLTILAMYQKKFDGLNLDIIRALASKYATEDGEVEYADMLRDLKAYQVLKKITPKSFLQSKPIEDSTSTTRRSISTCEKIEAELPENLRNSDPAHLAGSMIKPLIPLETRKKTLQPSIKKNVAGEKKTDDLEHMIAANVITRRYPLESRFVEYDQYRTGLIDTLNFARIVCDAIGRVILPFDLAGLIVRYRGTTAEQVNYINFLENIKTKYPKVSSAAIKFAIGKKKSRNQEEDASISNESTAVVSSSRPNTAPTSSMGGPRRSILPHIHSPTHTLDHLSDQDKEQLGILIPEVFHTVNARGCFLRPILDSFAVGGEAFITAKQFLRGLAMAGLLQGDIEAQKLIIRAFRPTNIHNPKNHMVNFMAFLNALDGVEAELKAKAAAEAAALDNAESGNKGTKGANENNKTIEDIAVSVKTSTHVRGPDMVLKELRRALLVDRMCLRENLRTHDPLRRGLMTRDCISRVFSRCRLEFSNEELWGLFDLYQHPEYKDNQGESMIIWTDLMNAIEELPAPVGISAEEKEMCSVSDLKAEVIEQALDEISTWKFMCPISVEEEKKLQKALAFLAHQIKIRRVELFFWLRDYDTTRRGLIFYENFIKVLSGSGIINSKDLMDCAPLLAKKFRDVTAAGGIVINYKAFLKAINDINEYGVDPAKTLSTAEFHVMTRKGGMPRPYTAPGGNKRFNSAYLENLQNPVGGKTKLKDILEKIKKQAAPRRIDVKDFLKDSDKLHQGEINASKLRSSLSTSGINLNEPEYKTIEDYFKSKKKEEKLNYKKFEEEVSKAVPPVELAGFSLLTEEERKQLSIILSDLKRKVATHGICIKHFFLAYDRSNSNQVTFNQCISVLKTVGIDLEESERKLLLRGFSVTGKQSKGAMLLGTGFVNYRHLLQKIDPGA